MTETAPANLRAPEGPPCGVGWQETGTLQMWTGLRDEIETACNPAPRLEPE